MGPRPLEIRIIPASDGTVAWTVSEKEQHKETQRENKFAVLRSWAGFGT